MAPSTPVDRSTPPLAGLLQAMLRRVRLLVGLPFGCAVLAGLWVYLFRGYISEAMFAPQSSDRNMSQMTGLVQQLGLPINIPGNSDGPEFYRDLIYSRDILRELANTPFTFPRNLNGTDTVTGTYVDLYKIKGRTLDDRLNRAAGRIRTSFKIGMDRAASVVTVRVTAKWPKLAEQMNRQLLDYVNQFNLDKRQSRFSQERQFAERQMLGARDSLEAAEAAQEGFLERNRAYRDDPALNTRFQRLTRRVELAQQVFQTLSQTFQQARIEEVRNTPLITVLQQPEHTAQPTIRLSTGMIIGFLIGLMVAIGTVVVGEYLSRERESNPEAYEQITALLPRRVLKAVGKG